MQQPRSFNPLNRAGTTGVAPPRPLKPATAALTNPADALLKPDDVLADMAAAWNRQDTNGSPTHFPSLHGTWSWMPGEATLVTGWPQHGKTELMLQLMLVKSVYDKWKWAIDCPENMPAWKLVRKLVQAYVGQTCHPKRRRLSRDEYDAACAWVVKHFHLVNPRKAGKLEEVLTVMQHAAVTHQTNGFLFDPWNTLTDNLKDYGGRDDEMLKHQLGKLCDFAEDYNQCAVVCAHPAGEARKSDGTLRVPDQYNVAQGRMWNNKVDNLLVVHRPYLDIDPTDNAVAFHAKKIKEQPETGFPTSADGITLTYQRHSFRYHDGKLGHSPLDPKALNTYRQHGTNYPQTASAADLTADFTPHGRVVRVPHNS